MPMTISRRGFIAGAAAALPTFSIVNRARAADVTLRYANASGPTVLSNMFMEKFGAALKERSGGRIELQLMLNAGAEPSMLESVSLGTVDLMCSGYSGVREMDVLYTPLLFNDPAHALRVLDGPLGPKISEPFEKRYNVRMLKYWVLGPETMSIKAPVTSWGELKGRKIRVPPFEGYTAATTAMGISPTPVAFNEVYLALQTNLVEGVVTLINAILDSKFNEVSKYAIRNDFGVGLDKFYMSELSWAKMPADLQTLFSETLDEMVGPDLQDIASANAQADFARWEASNGAGTVIDLDNAELREILGDFVQTYADEVFGAGTYDAIQADA